jgi:S-formylglutathione hydrolase FrmB
MRWFTYLLCALLLSVTSALAQAPGNPNDGMQPARNQLAQEIRGRAFDGPREGEQRTVWTWRPARATEGPLPVVYMFDGMDGLQVLLLRLKPAFDSGALPPVLFVAPAAYPSTEGRGAEYLRGYTGGADEYAAHERWLLNEVVPWAQRALGASSDRTQVFVAGYSFGGDLALSLANAHPDVFGGALVHSPVGANGGWVESNSTTQRWVVTGGTAEYSGSIRRSADVPRQVIDALRRDHAPLRWCVGRWGHNGPAWRDLSPGSLVWLLRLGDPQPYATALENTACRSGDDERR